MALTLIKDQPKSLIKDAKSQSNGRFYVGLKWDERSTDGSPWDLDGHAFILNKARKVLGNTPQEKAHNWIFWGNKQDPTGGVLYSGDNRTGAAAGDDEWLKLDWNLLPADANEVMIAANMYFKPEEQQAFKAKGQELPTFGSVSNTMFHLSDLVDDTPGLSLTEPFFLGEDVSDFRCAIFVSVYRNPANPSDLKVKVINAGYAEGIDALASAHDIDLEAAAKELGLITSNN